MKKILFLKKSRSFTLLEVLIAVFIFVVIVTLTIATIAFSFANKEKTKTVAAVQQNAQRIIQLFTNEVYLDNACRAYENLVTWGDIYGFSASASQDGNQPVSGIESPYLVTVFVDPYWQTIYRTYRLENNNLLLDETAPGKTYSRQINDPEVKIENLTFVTEGNVSTETNFCMSPGYRVGRQAYLKVNLTISAANTEQKGVYRLIVNKYISAKNFDYIVR